MKRVEEIVRKALVKEGIANADWRVEVRVNGKGYEYIRLEITVYEPRCKKPSTVWEAPYSTFKNLLYWNEAELVYNKYN